MLQSSASHEVLCINIGGWVLFWVAATRQVSDEGNGPYAVVRVVGRSRLSAQIGVERE